MLQFFNFVAAINFTNNIQLECRTAYVYIYLYLQPSLHQSSLWTQNEACIHCLIFSLTNTLWNLMPMFSSTRISFESPFSLCPWIIGNLTWILTQFSYPTNPCKLKHSDSFEGYKKKKHRILTLTRWPYSLDIYFITYETNILLYLLLLQYYVSNV